MTTAVENTQGIILSFHRCQ